MSGTQDIFHSRDSRCKSPYGAVPKGTQVQLTLRPRRAEGVSRCTLTARYEMDGDRTLTLPMEPAPEAPAAAPDQEQEDPKVFFHGKHLLVAEDFEMNLEILTQLLAMCGAQVTPARNGQEAVEAFQTAPPGTFDAILMDMNMPVLDGCGAAQAIRALDRPDAAGVRIVAVTANAFAEDAAASARAGMNAHIPKPIDLNLLAKTLRQLAERPS